MLLFRKNSNRVPFSAGLSRNVVVLGLVSLFQDVSSEMLYPVVPMFLAAVLGAPMTVIGLVEGTAEFIAAILKAVFGKWSDHLQRRQIFISLGYGLSALSRPLLFFAQSWGFVLASRWLDRFGKGVRTSPRDALLAASAPAEYRGKVFGLHRAMDTIGAVIGPLLAILLLSLTNNDYRFVFLIAIIPTVLAFLFTFLVKEIKTETKSSIARNERTDYWPLKTGNWPRTYWKFLGINTIFFLGNSSDVFLILRAQEIGLSAQLSILAYVIYNLAYALLATPAGIFSDRLGRRRVMQLGFILFAGVYAGFAFAKSTWCIWPLFALYGFYAAMTEGISKAAIADLVAPEHRGSAIGFFYMFTGFAALLASSLVGWIWQQFGAPVALGFSSGIALISASAMLGWKELR